MSTAALPTSTLSGRVITLYDAAGNPVEVVLSNDGTYRLSVTALGVEDKLDRIIQLLEDGLVLAAIARE